MQYRRAKWSVNLFKAATIDHNLNDKCKDLLFKSYFTMIGPSKILNQSECLKTSIVIISIIFFFYRVFTPKDTGFDKGNFSKWPMTGFEPKIYGVGGGCSYACATTI